MTRGSERDESETTAVEALYDAFAPSLYRYAWTLLGDDPEKVAEAVHDGLVAGAALETRRADPADRGPWLYALVRSACQRRGLAHVSPYTRLATVPAEEPVAHMFSRLPASHRELVELNLRHALPNSAVARVLGLDSQICVELSRSAIRRAAESLSEDTSSPDEPAWRTQVHRVSSALALLRPPGPPPDLRDRVVRTCVDPDLSGVRKRIAAGMHPLTVEGYPLHRARVPGEPEEVPDAVVPGPEPLPRALPSDRLTTRDHPIREEAVTPLTGPDTAPGDGDGDGRKGWVVRLRWPLPAVSGLATVIVAVSLWAWASSVGGPSTVVGTAPADSERRPQASETETEKAATASDAEPDAGSTASAPTAPPAAPDPEPAPEEQGGATGGDGAEQAPPSGEQGSSAEGGRPDDGSGGEGSGGDDASGGLPEEGESGDGGGDGVLGGLLGLLFGGG